jgi:OTU domain-containing protein 3
MAFSNFPWGSVPTIHLSYHLGEHYNSVRKAEDPCTGPAMPIGHELKIKEEVKQAVEKQVIVDQKEELKTSDTSADDEELPTVSYL